MEFVQSEGLINTDTSDHLLILFLDLNLPLLFSTVFAYINCSIACFRNQIYT